ncbi:hypothetical protein IQ266_11870 [filamentous cyanobacterium LEGE 11480]|uniref:Uncharacterized protein n=1 Tax=Romeriopsis navalis LEGE 11480 TaxID=2777977 RepID=A0A928VQV0_9CYAN|nr:hypothetical protein [Romeriopsis navalis]MBE9030429.1 hypothetical protein [Romeriopsis navalis LEGE 11480]
MALPTHVKTYLAYWFQLGRGLRMPPGNQLIKPQTVLADGDYSRDFEVIWQQLSDPKVAAQSYLDGTVQTIAQLLEPTWEIQDCARCSLPVPMKATGLPTLSCPCDELQNIPDLTELPPRQPIDSKVVLQDLCQRLETLGVSS